MKGLILSLGGDLGGQGVEGEVAEGGSLVAATVKILGGNASLPHIRSRYWSNKHWPYAATGLALTEAWSLAVNAFEPSLWVGEAPRGEGPWASSDRGGCDATESLGVGNLNERNCSWGRSIVVDI